MKLSRTLVLALVPVFLLAACSSVPAGDNNGTASTLGPEPEPEQTAPAPAEVPTRAMPIDTLSAVLEAEIRGFRGDSEAAIDLYLEALKESRDPELARYATLLAMEHGLMEKALQAAVLWYEIKPNNPQALAAVVPLLSQAGEVESAFFLAQESGDMRLVQQVAADTASRGTLNQMVWLLEELDRLALEQPASAHVASARSLLLGVMQRFDEAIIAARLAIQLDPSDTLALQILIESLAQQGASFEAAQILESWLVQNWQLRRIRGTMISYYMAIDPPIAADSIERLMTQVPDPEALAGVAAEVNMSAGRFEAAQRHFLALSRQPEFRERATLQLGLIAETQGDAQQAFDYYRRIEPGPFYQEAQDRIVDLVAQTGSDEALLEHFAEQRSRYPDIAETLFGVHINYLNQLDFIFSNSAQMAFLTEALALYPDNTGFLYGRSLMAERMGDIDQAEQDLRRILASDPSSSTALNALGYTLANRTDRYDEAYLLIEQALAIEPDSPAIQDSMGWVLYKLGRYEEALYYLVMAQDAYYDPEVISHHAEVLWAMGRTDDALDLIDQSLLDFPGDSLLGELRERILTALGQES